jgi:hypothetical protein
VVRDLLVEILRLYLIHHLEETFHLLPEQVAGISGGNLEHFAYLRNDGCHPLPQRPMAT